MRKHEIDKTFERIAEEIRNEQPDRATVEAAADRVWRKLGAEAPEQQIEKIRDCADFQALIPSYLHGGLSSGRKLLLEDHTRECVPCRRALKEARQGRPAQARQAQSRDYGVLKVAIAAMIFITFAYGLMPFIKQFFNYAPTVSAMVELADGHVYTVANSGLRALTAGVGVAPGEIVRTGKDGAAILKLNDGSTIEMNERSEFALSDDGNGRAIRLKRGSIIVQAAEQKAGRLYVTTEDCLVSVKGTTFSVTSGTKGSRVSVLSGEVVFDHAGQERTLKPGEQAVTGSNLDQVPLKDEVAWSRNRDRYLQLISELESLRKEIAKVPVPALRTASNIIDLLPERTVFYVALPNLSQNLSESYKLFQQRVSESPTLQEWFGKKHSDTAELMRMVEQIGGYIGDELVLGGVLNATARPHDFLAIAEVRDRDGLANLLSAKGVPVISDPAMADSGMSVWLSDRFIVVAPNGEALKAVAARVQQPADSGFAKTQFYARIKDVYSDGAGLIIAADVENMISASDKERLASLGLSNVRHFIAEQKQVDGKTRNRAVLTFKDKRNGVASWLASPAPMGALEYISPEANLAAAFVVKEPSLLFDDLLGFLSKEGGFQKALSDLEAKHGISLKRDFAEVIGGEFAFAVDGPILPTPSWKMVLEVYDAGRLQSSIEATVAAANREAPEARLALSKSEANGLTIYTIKPEKGGISINYAFTNGYLVAAASPGLVERAVKYRQSGYTLLRAPKFTAALPEDGSANFSAVLYQDLTTLLSPVAEEMNAEGRVLADLAPTLVAAYAYKDRVVVAANTEGGPFGLNPAMLFGMPGSASLQKMMRGATRQKK